MRAWTVFVRNESLDRVQHESLDTTRVRQALGQFIDGAGGVIMRRWGDAPIRTLSLHLLEWELNLKFRQYRGLVLHHKAWHSTEGVEGSRS